MLAANRAEGDGVLVRVLRDPGVHCADQGEPPEPESETGPETSGRTSSLLPARAYAQSEDAEPNPKPSLARCSIRDEVVT
jgi:hypothetical protein